MRFGAGGQVVPDEGRKTVLGFPSARSFLGRSHQIYTHLQVFLHRAMQMQLTLRTETKKLEKRSFPGPGCCDHARARCFGWMGADEGDMGGGKEEEKEEEEEEEEGQPDWTNLPAWLLQYHESGVFTVRHLLRDPDEEDSTLESTEVWTARDDTVCVTSLYRVVGGGRGEEEE
ncbi:hypothetical protein B2J93_4311 [Marssonina coronariae]|uniref:Uncharacterized protein n=1 Tax=Diplocarpon coronariae TaxID=2795749 RepID=A0A218YYJ8_9HELO|nr:hypothetical protein B2J93_4311 [Marssonina coronariae]